MERNENITPARGFAAETFIRNIPFIVIQVVAACCVIAEVFILRQPRFAVAAIPLEILAFAFLWGANKRRGAGVKQ